MTKSDIEKLAKFFEILIKIDQRKKKKQSPTSYNSNSRN